VSNNFKNCRHEKSCSLYQDKSVTCQNNGEPDFFGNFYCGMHRELDRLLEAV
jgi:hypothetical protein